MLTKRNTLVFNHILSINSLRKCITIIQENLCVDIKQLLDEVEHDIMNSQNRGLCYSASADNTDMRF